MRNLGYVCSSGERLGQGGSGEGRQTQSSDLLWIPFVQAGLMPIPSSPREAVNRPLHLLSFTSLHKPSLPHTLEPTQIPHPHPLRPTPLSSQASPHTAHSFKHKLACTHTSLCWINTDSGGSVGREGWVVFSWCFPAKTKGYLTSDRKVICLPIYL